jgi:hypothetical protein
LFESDATDVPITATKEKVAEIAADFMTTFTRFRSDYWRRRSFALRRSILAGWIRGHRQRAAERNVLRVVLPNGTVVEPSVARRL